MTTGPDHRAVVEMLTAPGAPFEIETVEVHGRQVRDFCRRPRSFAELAQKAAQWDERDFLVEGDHRLSYAAFFQSAERLAAGLRTQTGLAKGDRVAILAANGIGWCKAFWASLLAGGVVVALNGWWKAEEIEYGLEDCGAAILIADPARLRRVAELLPGLSQLRHIFLVGEGEAPEDPRCRPLTDLEGGSVPALAPVPCDEDDPATIFYTSGTTGRSKGAVNTHRGWISGPMNLTFAAVASAIERGADPTAREPETVLATLPLFHVGGCHSTLIAAPASGAKIVFTRGRFSATEVMSLIERERVTRWSAVPTMLWRLHAHPDRARFDLSTVRTVGYGGSPSSTELAQAVSEVFPNAGSVSNAYGLTESGTVFTAIAGADLLARPGSVGRPFPTAEVVIRDLAGAPVPPKTEGQITVRGPMVMLGYWNRPKDTAEIIVDGWLQTGDIGFLDADGFLYVTDRAKDMIIRGGENIYPAEIELCLDAHPDVVESAVIGVPHPELGEEGKAIVRLREGAEADAPALRDWIARSLADFKVPAHFEFRSEPLPRNATGKIIKPLLRGGAPTRFEEML